MAALCLHMFTNVYIQLKYALPVTYTESKMIQ